MLKNGGTKVKVSSARKNKRRSNVWKLNAPALMDAQNAVSLKLLIKVCAACGYCNNGREVIKKDA